MTVLATDIDQGVPVKVLSGAHVGCFELFGSETVRGIRDLKGKTVAVSELGSSSHVFLASMLAYVGLDAEGRALHHRDVGRRAAAARRAAHRRVPRLPSRAADPAFPRHHLRRRQQHDRPAVVAVLLLPRRRQPGLRAILRSVDVCAREPERAARFLVGRGFAQRYDFALELMQQIPYGRWREYDPEDTVRFYALRLKEAGMIKSNPKDITAKSADWRFLNQLK